MHASRRDSCGDKNQPFHLTADIAPSNGTHF